MWQKQGGSRYRVFSFVCVNASVIFSIPIHMVWLSVRRITMCVPMKFQELRGQPNPIEEIRQQRRNVSKTPNTDNTVFGKRWQCGAQHLAFRSVCFGPIYWRGETATNKYRHACGYLDFSCLIQFPISLCWLDPTNFLDRNYGHIQFSYVKNSIYRLSFYS